MTDTTKSKAQLIEEIKQLRQRVNELEGTNSKQLSFEQYISQTIVDTSPAFFVVIDSRGETKMVNKSMLDATGYSEAEIREKDYLSTFVPERERDSLSKLFQEELLKGKTTRNQNHIVTKDGRELFVDWEGRPFLGPNDEIELFCGVGLDITERKRIEDEQNKLTQHERKRHEELEKLREVSTSMRQAEGSKELLQVFTEEMQRLCRADVASSILFKTHQEPVILLSSKENIKLSQEQSEAINSALLNAKTGELKASIPEFKSVLILQLQSPDAIHGAALVASQALGAFSADERNIAIAIADMAGTALNRIEILETLEERVQQRTRNLIVLYNLITIISENWNLKDLLELSLVLTLETVEADRGIIYLSDGKDPPGIKPVIQRGFADGFQINLGSLPDDTLAREVFKKQKPLSIDNLNEDSAFANFKGLASYAGIPILARGNTRGVFSLFSNSKEAFDIEEMALLASIADHLGIGIENSILYEQSRESAALEERNRLARDLHDSVSQLLYSLTLMAGTTKKMLERGSSIEAIKNSVERLGDTAHRALKEMRLLLFELRPAVLESEGLVGALQHRIKTVEEGLGLSVEFQAEGLPDLPNYVEDALYHIAMEAFNNIVKHSEGTTASIKFTMRNDIFVMEISDNGKGFDTDLLQRGLGLRNMRERGQMLDSEVIISSMPGEGTRVTVETKLPSSSLLSSR